MQFNSRLNYGEEMEIEKLREKLIEIERKWHDYDKDHPTGHEEYKDEYFRIRERLIVAIRKERAEQAEKEKKKTADWWERNGDELTALRRQRQRAIVKSRCTQTTTQIRRRKKECYDLADWYFGGTQWG